MSSAWSYKTYAVDGCGEQGAFKCYNGGTCMRIELNASLPVLICQCPDGFTGRQCEQAILPPSPPRQQQPCSPDPCAPFGYCNAAPTEPGFRCECKPGYEGTKCEHNVNECLNATCFNGGLCIDGVNSYECECKWPFVGRYCQTRASCAALPDLCKNNGVCIDDPHANPICVCAVGYTGQDCSTRLSSSKCPSSVALLCLHGSLCRLGYRAGYECVCRPGYTGKHCQLVDVCVAQQPCSHNATCVSLIRSDAVVDVYPKYTCQCPTGYFGLHCERKSNPASQTLVILIMKKANYFHTALLSILSIFNAAVQKCC